MCLILLAVRQHPDHPLVLAANRDEFHGRPTAAMATWPGKPSITAGRDLLALGTWLGVSETGRFAAVTNIRGAIREPESRSRGMICVDWLRGTSDALEFAASVTRELYAPFNLLFGQLPDRLFHFCGQTGKLTTLADGYHGLSNGTLNNNWPKVVVGKRALADVIRRGASSDDLFRILADRSVPADDALPDTGIGQSLERRLSARFILGPEYGTRASTVLLADREGGADLYERRFAADGSVTGETRRILRFVTRQD